mmetsp:Transcript_70729/g.169362  ORF Transcript_70729/g.169362 Transcript_70729/m.169362 type:complete len:358 (+) Transcript_70729:84-1157(+)|eukprot:CAMPEP_0178410106 /NCGR_PEP_ID=MMETSP0689_2-20121128/20808_1 /TAXON_ID=160604 /ORGANISM="Amphidinium massartii, Strain CS-259" /LENGTH=357 /DNA_ID=CAMNT_0020031271 /DNA_START=46 /DNA_END=1119 /DNA_ORIENTATION=-
MGTTRSLKSLALLEAADLMPCVANEPWIVDMAPSLRRALAWSTITLFSALFYLTVAVLCCIPLLFWNALRHSNSTSLYAGVALFALSIVLALHPTYEWPAARRLCQLYYEIFQVKHNLTAERAEKLVQEGEQDIFILGMHPHGIIPIQSLLWCAFCDQYVRTKKRGTLYGFGGMATIITRLPFLRTILGWLNGGPADYATLKRGLRAGKNLYMLPGGLAEIFTAQPGRDVAVWRNRRGLCRLALETGARLTPLYVFGGNDFFEQLVTSDSWIAKLSRRIGASITLYWGRFGLPIPFVPQPGCVIAMGEPLPSVRCAGEKPTDDEVEALHARYEAALLEVFERTKAAAGRPEAVLEIR